MAIYKGTQGLILPAEFSRAYVGSTQVYQTGGSAQYGVQFNGSNSAIALGTGLLSNVFNGSTDFTIQAYCSRNGSASAYVNTFREHIETDFYVTSGAYSFRMKDGTTHAIDATVEQSNGWCILIGTYNHTTNQMRFILNGTVIGTETVTTPSYVKDMSDMFSSTYGAGYTFDGTIANFAVYNIILTDQQIAGLSGKGVISGANLLHHWNFQDGSGDTLTDVIGGVNGTLANCTWVTI